ncbi:hypothetical protein GOBAR_AA10295 [Gossypium barbadense]|uniref:Uncharacterized protein n=1 Tax=Gossypium barbadense TaxID=3634 RepID=A0A2P5Y474_GOSBA|nr:hypothetical protein GOBAR_AA10295 [Gossypium barbadense]
MVKTENVTRACDMPVPSTRGRHCQNQHGRGPMYTGVGEVNEARHGSATRPCAPTLPKNTGVGRMSDVPKFKIRKMYNVVLVVRRSQFPPQRRGNEQRHPWVLPWRLGIRSSRDIVPASATYDPSRSKASAHPPSLRHVNDLAYFIALAILHQTERHRRGVISIGPYVTRLARHFGLLNTAAQSSSFTLIGQMSTQSISSMLSMRMIEKRRGTYPPQYRIVQSTEEEDPEDITDDVPPRHEEFMRRFHTLTSLSTLLDSSNSVFSASITLMLLYSRFHLWSPTSTTTGVSSSTLIISLAVYSL